MGEWRAPSSAAFRGGAGGAAGGGGGGPGLGLAAADLAVDDCRSAAGSVLSAPSSSGAEQLRPHVLRG